MASGAMSENFKEDQALLHYQFVSSLNNLDTQKSPLLRLDYDGIVMAAVYKQIYSYEYNEDSNRWINKLNNSPLIMHFNGAAKTEFRSIFRKFITRYEILHGHGSIFRLLNDTLLLVDSKATLFSEVCSLEALLTF